MKSKIIQFIFLVVAGLIIGWREWSSNPKISTDESTLLNGERFQEVGSASEASMVFIIFFLGAFVALMMSHLRFAPFKLSSPNSV